MPLERLEYDRSTGKGSCVVARKRERGVKHLTLAAGTAGFGRGTKKESKPLKNFTFRLAGPVVDSAGHRPEDRPKHAQGARAAEHGRRGRSLPARACVRMRTKERFIFD